MKKVVVIALVAWLGSYVSLAAGQGSASAQFSVGIQIVSSEEQAESVRRNTRSITVEKANLFSKPQVSSAVLKQVDMDEQVLVLELGESWARVRVKDGTTGYVWVGVFARPSSSR